MLFQPRPLPDHVEIAGRLLPLVATRRRGMRGVRLRADAVTATIRLSLPWRGGIPEALALIESHRGWLARHVGAWPQDRPLVPGARIPFDGGELLIDWAAERPRTPRRDGDRLVLGGPEALVAGRVLRWLKAEALALLTAETQEYAARLDRPVGEVRVGDPRGRWGSCAVRDGQGRIAYSWRLVMAPAQVRRHIVAHECAHLVHQHHGPAFHRLLATLDPHAATVRHWLKREGAALHRVARD